MIIPTQNLGDSHLLTRGAGLDFSRREVPTYMWR